MASGCRRQLIDGGTGGRGARQRPDVDRNHLIRVACNAARVHTVTCYLLSGEAIVSPARARNGLRTPVAQRVQKHRKALRAAGLRPIQIWVPDVRSKRFAAQAHRQSLAVANSPYEKDDQAFIDSISDWSAT
jgi:Protein  of unknown function (DUF3018)